MSHLQNKSRKRFLKKLGISNNHKGIVIAETVFTLSVIIISWIFFRSDTVKQAGEIIRKIFNFSDYTLVNQVRTNVLYLGEPLWRFIWLIILLLVFILAEYMGVAGKFIHKIAVSPRLYRWGFYYGLIFLILCVGAFGRKEFIYFQF